MSLSLLKVLAIPFIGTSLGAALVLFFKNKTEGLLVRSLNGFAALRMSKVLTKKLIEKTGLSFFDENEKDTLAVDMLKEVLNVITGNFLTELESANATVSLPFISQGKDHILKLPTIPVIAIPYISSFGPFLVLTGIVENPQAL